MGSIPSGFFGIAHTKQNSRVVDREIERKYLYRIVNLPFDLYWIQLVWRSALGRWVPRLHYIIVNIVWFVLVLKNLSVKLPAREPASYVRRRWFVECECIFRLNMIFSQKQDHNSRVLIGSKILLFILHRILRVNSGCFFTRPVATLRKNRARANGQFIFSLDQSPQAQVLRCYVPFHVVPTRAHLTFIFHNDEGQGQTTQSL